MKTIIIALLLVLAGTTIYYVLAARKPISQASPKKTENHKMPLTIVFFQDVSGSISKHGVELVTPEIFVPLFADRTRTIDLYFGCIASLSAKKLLHLYLPASSLQVPPTINFDTVEITRKRQVKEAYLLALKTYQVDSIAYYKDREQRISQFKREMVSTLSPYQNNLTNATDLSTAVQLADKIFAYPLHGKGRNVLLLNSDGQDSFGHHVHKMKTQASVVLINAAATHRTSVDSIITISLESPEQAIQYSLQ